MALQSMTGFGKGEAEGEKYKVSVEMKSVNHRFKDIRFKMGSLLNSIELPMKKKIDQNFKRGSFDIFVNYKRKEKAQSSFELDKEKIKAFLKDLKECSDETGVAINVNPTGFLKNEFYLEDEDKESELHELTLNAFELAMASLSSSRAEEGQKLVDTLKKHQEIYTEHYNKVASLKDSYQDKVREKLLSKFSQENLQIEDQRFQQEVIYYLEKLDIDEEINRIDIHLQKLNKTLDGKSEVGRQIDFMVQELNRETNTIGSKSASTDISESVVQMKAQLEKIREQALNLE
ncbi:MAG: YicC family protein [Bacteriovoracaceae bacterium]|nr:YicC family protein [Bacteriovoracaceae bacterium]